MDRIRSSLLAANETLQKISAGLTALRVAQDQIVAGDASHATRQLASERSLLAFAAFAAFILLTYAFVANHRVLLARAKIRTVAEQAETRFQEYFEKHPLAMMIYDTTTLNITRPTGGDGAIRLQPRRSANLEPLSY